MSKMGEKELKDMEFDELRNRLTGNALMSIGQGEPFRTAVFEVMRVTLMWRAEREKTHA